MITITNKTDCCGCGACASRCVTSCITMAPDEEGFNYPLVDTDKCIHCGLCERVCPLLHKPQPHEILAVIGCKNKNEAVRFVSSSGGFFSIAAEKILGRQGTVFGAAFDDNWHVRHIAVTSGNAMNKLRGSKYVQSDISTTYQDAEKLLQAGHTVLFSGTPCQIGGLKGYLRKDYERLYTIDVVCHGVPSPKVYQTRLDEVTELSSSPVIKVNFRDKTPGWKRFNIVFQTENHIFATHKRRGPYMRLFLNNVSTRPSCSDCAFNNKHSLADLTIADYWGVNKHFPLFDDDKGVTLVLVNTEKGAGLFADCQSELECQQTDFKRGAEYNAALSKKMTPHPSRQLFFAELDHKSLSALANEILGTAEN